MRLIWRKGGLLGLRMYQKSLDSWRVKRRRKGFCGGRGFILITKVSVSIGSGLFLCEIFKRIDLQKRARAATMQTQTRCTLNYREMQQSDSLNN